MKITRDGNREKCLTEVQEMSDQQGAWTVQGTVVSYLALNGHKQDPLYEDIVGVLNLGPKTGGIPGL
jgi:hypothetical protein